MLYPDPRFVVLWLTSRFARHKTGRADFLPPTQQKVTETPEGTVAWLHAHLQLSTAGEARTFTLCAFSWAMYTNDART